MKFAFLALTVLATTSVFANEPKFINCENERGIIMEVERNGVETVVPLYDVKMKSRGEVYESFEVRLLEVSEDQVTLEGDLPHGYMINIGLNRKDNSAYYQKSANQGMSPLPGLFFTDCAVR